MARVLIVENDPDQLAIRRLIVEAAGHEVVDGPECDVVLMDLRIPTAADGRALIRRMKAAGRRVVVLTGDAGELRGQEEGRLADVVLEKPCRSEKWLAAVSAA
jgi:CheY-like chemotaxis protein